MNTDEVFDLKKIEETADKVIAILEVLNPMETSFLIQVLKVASDTASKEYVKKFPADMQEELLRLMTTP